MYTPVEDAFLCFYIFTCTTPQKKNYADTSLPLFCKPSYKPVPTVLNLAMPYHQTKPCQTSPYERTKFTYSAEFCPFQTNHFPFQHVAIHKHRELYFCAYLYR